MSLDSSISKSILERLSDANRCGHELQHALGVSGNPNVVGYYTFARYCMRAVATGDDSRFETESADRVGLRVEMELKARSMCNR